MHWMSQTNFGSNGGDDDLSNDDIFNYAMDFDGILREFDDSEKWIKEKAK